MSSVKCTRSSEVLNLRNELELILEQAQKLSKDLKINKQEALLLMIAHELAAIHYHIDKVIFGLVQTHTQKEEGPT